MSGWLWLLAGLLLGALIVGLAWLKGQSDDSGGKWVGAQPDRPPQGKPVTAPPRRVEVPPAPKPRFDFYNMLPEMEVVVPDEELDLRPSAPESAQQADSATYLVQVGSFKRDADADRLKAQLALLGIEAKVVSARIGPQDLRYRVRTGPYRGRAALDKARQQLAGNGFKGIVIRVDGG